MYTILPRLAALTACGVILCGCTEITTNAIIGEVDLGWSINGADTVLHDVAADLEGTWLGGWESEEARTYFVEHAGAGSLRVWIPVWNNDALAFTMTVAVASQLGGDAFLNINPINDNGRDSTRYWPFRYVSENDQVRLHLMNEEFVRSAYEAKRLSAIDSLDDDRIGVDAGEIGSLLYEFDWEPWVVDEIMILRRVAELPE